MSNLQEKGISLLGMREADIARVMEIEKQSYSHPWTEGIFQDCIRVGYPAWVMLKDNAIIGYVVLSVGANEAHLLNICIAKAFRRQGLAQAVLIQVIELLQEKNYQAIFLEVRESNTSAEALYEKIGFVKIGCRKEYYESKVGRENAITYKLELK